jgi:hypothetical protein
MNMIEIERALRELRLSGIAETRSTRVMQAQAAQEPFLETFAAMLQDELDRRRSRLTERRFKRSGLDERPSLADFDWRFNPKLPRSACFELHTLKFIGEGANQASCASNTRLWTSASGITLPANACRPIPHTVRLLCHLPVHIAQAAQSHRLSES